MKTLLLAAASELLVRQNYSQLQGELDLRDAALMSTRPYTLDGVSEYVSVDGEIYMPDQSCDFSRFEVVVIIQSTHAVVDYLNVYRFLLHNGVQNVSVKVLNASPVPAKLSVLATFDSLDVQHAEVLWVDPSKITLSYAFPQAQSGEVLGGDWDTEAKSFSSSISFYDSLVERVTNNKDWKETTYYSDVMTSIANGNARFGCQTESEFLLRLDKLDALFAEIRDEGWQQREKSDFVTVNIGRNGELIFNDGRHRLSIAKVLGLKSIPVKVAIRHPLWQDFKNEIALYADNHGEGNVYTKIDHPDLVEVASTNDDPRFDIIYDSLSQGHKTLLDIGCHWGYFCHRFEDVGLQCTGVEAEVKNFYFMQKIKKACEKQFTPIRQSIFDFVTPNTHFDVVLALNIFHHFLKTESLHQALIQLLNNLSVNELFLQTHAIDEPQMIGAFRNYSEDEFADFIVEHSPLTKWKRLYAFSNGRVMYHVS